MTRAIIEVARPLGIAVHDHIIVGKDGHASLKALKLPSRRGIHCNARAETSKQIILVRLRGETALEATVLMAVSAAPAVDVVRLPRKTDAILNG